ncbi:PcfM protein, partial [Enterococcus faecalis]
MEGRINMSEKKKKYCVTIVETKEVAVSVFAETEEQ